MEWNRLLKRQIRKFLHDEELNNPRLAEFIRTVNNSYNGFERDQDLAAHAFSISEMDYANINEKLQQEVEIKKAGIRELKQAIIKISDPENGSFPIDLDEDNLLDTLQYLEQLIEKRKASELELERSKARLTETANRLSLLVANLQRGILLEDENGKLIHTNQFYCDIFGLKEAPEKYTGKDCLELVSSTATLYKLPHQTLDLLVKLREDGKLALDNNLELADGRVLSLDLVPIYVNQKFNGFLWKFADITRELLLQQTTRRLSLVASANTSGVIIADDEGRINWCNEGFAKITGYTRDEILGRTPIELCQGPDTDKETLRKVLEAFSKGKDFNVEILYYRKDGTSFWGRTKGQALKEESSLYYFGIIEDITFDKEQEKRFEQLSLVASANTAGIITFTREETVEWLNSAYENITGYSLNDLRGKSPLPFVIGPLTDKEVMARMAASAAQQKNITEEFIHYRKDGSTFWSRVAMQFVHDSEGRLVQHFVIVEDITERKMAEKAMQVNEEKYRNIITNMNLGLVEVDNEDIIQFANHTFCEMSGFELQELIGQAAAKKFTWEKNVGVVKGKNELRKNGISDAYELAVKNKRGEIRWWLISGAPRYNDKGELLGSIGIHLDITNQKKLELDLKEAREAALQSASAKEAFLTNMSHEIRTPMNAVLGMTRQLMKTALNEQQRFYLNVINDSAEHLLVIINDILDISKIEAGKLQLEYIGFKPSELVKHCLQVVRHKAEEKGLQLINATSCDPNCILMGDPYRLTQVILNLLSNAIKFTEKGSVTLAGAPSKENPSNPSIIFVVSDTGIGMSEEYMQHVFENFTQEERDTARKYGGSGLGMAITHQLVKLMNGTIAVKSHKGIGSVFTVKIPAFPGTEADLPEKGKVEIDSSILKGKRILLAEDNEINRLVATTVLANVGAVVVEVENGQEAIRELLQHRYDAVLMDLQMPVMGGLEATRKIRSEVDKDIPVIALTANAIKGESDRCREAGMTGFVSKPFNEAELINKLAASISNNPETGTTEKELPAHTNLNGERLYDLWRLKQISRGNLAFEQRMVNLFLEKTPEMFNEMKLASQKGQLETVRAIAHKMKPSVDNMGMQSLLVLIREIENKASAIGQQKLNGLIDQVEALLHQVMEQLRELDIKN